LFIFKCKTSFICKKNQRHDFAFLIKYYYYNKIILKNKTKKMNLKLKQFCTIGACLLFTNSMTAQSKGDSIFMNTGDLYAAATAYEESLAVEPNNHSNLFMYAVTLAQLGDKDSAMYYLNKCIGIEKNYAAAATRAAYLVPLHTDKNWPSIEEQSMVAMEKITGKKITKPELAKQLWRMLAKDQQYMQEVKMAGEKMGQFSTVTKAVGTLKNKINKELQAELLIIIDKNGWPKKSEVGEVAATGAFMVIQHADLAKQKQYLPTIEALCKKGEASWESYAMMYDRIQMREEKPQKYGTQVKMNEMGKYELHTLLDKTKVEAWRIEAGLKPLAEYLKQFGVEYK
jgi:tetratricopeptide (TPR) repeat protein